MKTQWLVAVLVLLLVASLGGNAWQEYRVRYRDLVIQEKIQMALNARKDAASDLEQLRAQHAAQWEDARNKWEQVVVTAQASREALEKLIAAQSEQLQNYESALAASEQRSRIRPVVTTSAAPSSRTTYGASEPVRAPAPPSERVLDAASRHAERYFKTQHQNGSGSTLVFDMRVDLDGAREVPGWNGRYEVTGVCWYQYYDSVWGGSFRGVTQHFSADVETQGGATKVTGFSLRSGPPL